MPLLQLGEQENTKIMENICLCKLSVRGTIDLPRTTGRYTQCKKRGIANHLLCIERCRKKNWSVWREKVSNFGYMSLADIGADADDELGKMLFHRTIKWSFEYMYSCMCKKQNRSYWGIEPHPIWTDNLSIWSRTRYRCASSPRCCCKQFTNFNISTKKLFSLKKYLFKLAWFGTMSSWNELVG